MRFSTEWLDHGPNVSAEERATLCRFRLYVSEENACRFYDPTSNSACDHVTVPAVHLAEGLAADWWSIFGGRDREHPLRNYRTGFALPDVTLGFDGSTLEVRGGQFAVENPNVRFWQVGVEALPRDVAESTLAKFIEDVSGRLASAGVSNSEVALRWSRVAQSLGEPDERAFCEAAGALGADPYGVSESDTKFIEDAARLFSGEALLEFLAGVGDAARGELLNWVREVEDRPQEQTCLPALHENCRSIRKGYVAQAGRARLGDRLPGGESVSRGHGHPGRCEIDVPVGRRWKAGGRQLYVHCRCSRHCCAGMSGRRRRSDSRPGTRHGGLGSTG